jgi:hypothetical protein
MFVQIFLNPKNIQLIGLNVFYTGLLVKSLCKDPFPNLGLETLPSRIFDDILTI